MHPSQLRRLDLGLLLIFDALSRHRKLSLVASELGLTRSAISHALARLRELFQDDLFVRHASGVQATPRAQMLAPKVAAIIALTSETLIVERDFDPKVSRRTVRIGMSEYGASLFGPSLGAILEEQAPNMRLEILLLPRDEMLEGVTTHKLDLALHSFVRGVDDLIAEDLFTENLMVATRQDHPIASATLTLDVYLRSQHIHVVREGEASLKLNSIFTRLGHVRDAVLTLPFYLPAIEAAATTDRLLTIPGRLGAHYAKTVPIRLFRFPMDDCDFPVSLISSSASESDPGICWVRRNLRNVARGTTLRPDK